MISKTKSYYYFEKIISITVDQMCASGEKKTDKPQSCMNNMVMLLTRLVQ
jgi:hypothetical protein